MATLSSAIVKQRVASMRDVEEALARQVLYGGDLATNLLEAANVSEAALTQVLAHCQGLPAAPVGELPPPGPDTLRRIPAELAIRHGFFPIGEGPGELWVAVAEPIPAEVAAELAFPLGVRIVQHTALPLRVREALARYYDGALDRRQQQVLAQLSARATATSQTPPAAPPAAFGAGLGNLPRPDTLPPHAYPPAPALSPPPPPALDGELLRASAGAAATTSIVPLPIVSVSADPSPSTSEREVRDAQHRGASPPPSLRGEPPPPATLASPVTSAASRPPGSVRPRPRRGPYTAAMAERDLKAATNRDEILRTWFDFAAQYFEYAALFTIQGDVADGREAHGPGADRDAVTRLSFPLDRPSLFAKARDGGAWVLAPLGDEGVDANLAYELDRRHGQPVLVLPVSLRGRAVLLLFGDHGEEGVELGAVGDVLAFAGLTATALERLIRQRKLTARRAVALQDALETMPQPLVAPARGARLPPVEIRARALSAALGQPGSEPPSPNAASATNPAPPRLRTAAGTAPSVRSIDPEIQGAMTPRVPPAIRASWTEPISSTRDTAALRQAAAVVVGGMPDAVSREQRQRHLTTPGVAPPPAGAARPAMDGPEITVETADFEDVWGPGEERFDLESNAPADAGGAPLAAAARSVHVEPTAPRRGQQSHEMRLPSVIVDVESDARLLVARIVHGDTSAVPALVELGEPAITALIAAFPGPIEVEPRGTSREGLLPSRCGPLLLAVSQIGPVAVPYLIVRGADPDPLVRAWSVRMLGELQGRDAARTIALRCADDDEQVRHAALAGARLLQRHHESRAALREYLLATAQDPMGAVNARHATIETLGRLGDPEAVPGLIALLAEPRPDLVKSAVWGLVALTLQDFGSDPAGWQRWWELNRSHHRIEWLIDALTQDNQELRHVAGEELKLLTREYFGYYDDLPPDERTRAQQRYREWWQARGRALFT